MNESLFDLFPWFWRPDAEAALETEVVEEWDAVCGGFPGVARFRVGAVPVVSCGGALGFIQIFAECLHLSGEAVDDPGMPGGEVRLFFTHDPEYALASVTKNEKGAFTTENEMRTVEGMTLETN